MELIHALRETGILSPDHNDMERLTVTAINNNGYRASTSSTSRFLVKTSGEPLCAVKKLTINGPFQIDDMLAFQKLLREMYGSMVPEIYGVYRTETDVYVVEEYFQGDSLEHLLLSGTIGIEEAVERVSDIFAKLQNAEIDQSDFALVKQKELQSILDTLHELDMDPLIKDRLADDILHYSDQMFQKLCYKTGDLILRNIFCNGDKTHLLDFDLTRKTCALWVDLIRMIRYAKYEGIDMSAKKFADILPIGAPTQLLTAVMYLDEMRLQRGILDAAYYTEHYKALAVELFDVIKTFYEIDAKDIVFPLNGDDLSRYVEIFWTESEEEGFNAKNASRKPVRYDQWATYEFELPVQHLHALRLDPMNHHGWVEISRFEIKGQAAYDLYPVEFERLVFQGSLEGFWLGRLCGISFGEDPQIVINSVNIDGPVIVSIDMRVSEKPGKMLMNEYLEQKRQYEHVTEELQNYQLQLQNLQESLESINGLAERLTETNRQMKNELDTVLSSTSWKWTKPLRTAGRVARSIASSMRRMAFLGGRRVKLIPINHLEHISGNEWRSVGNDPHFEWRKPVLGGRIIVCIAGKTDRVTPLQLYYDTGDGYKETQVIEAGRMNMDGEISKRIIRLPQRVVGLRLDIGEYVQTIHLDEVRARKISRIEMLLYLINEYFKLHGFSIGTVSRLVITALRTVRENGLSGLLQKTKQFAMRTSQGELIDYQSFLRQEAVLAESESSMRQNIATFAYKPLISVLVPVYNVDAEWLNLCVQSVKKQVYENWELCIVDDCSTKAHIRPMLEEFASQDSRIKIKFRESNGHISRTSNDALEMATGEFIALLDHDDELSPDALYENVKLLNLHPDTDIIYSDEDKITTKGERHSPFFKPDWSPDLLLSHMYTCHLTVYRKSLVERAGGFRVGFEGSQDYDLMLRATELTDRIRHIPKVLYHWRTIPSSTSMSASAKNYTHFAGRRALEEAVERRKLAATVHEIEGCPNMYLLRYLPMGNPKISIIIPTRNMAAILSNCLQSIFEKTTYNNFEVIVIDNGSDDQENFKLYNHWREREPQRFFVYEYDIPFNYSIINNYGVSKATGELLLMLNNDVEVITPDWLTEMAGQAVRPEIGAVGACLYYPDNTVQHGGVILGVAGVANHSHKHFLADHPGYFGRLTVVSNYSAVTGACLMIKKDIYEEVGGLEETLEVAYGDIDFCLKVREKGYYNIWLPHVKLYHHESKSRGAEDTPEKKERLSRETKFMEQKWGHVLQRDPFYNPNLTLVREDFSLGSPYISDGKIVAN